MSIDPSRLPDLHGLRRLHPLVAAAAEALETVGVQWALLRGEHDLGDPRGDVDILVDGSRGLSAVERALRPLGIVAVPQLGAGAHRVFVGYHRPTRRWIEFDIEWDLDFGPQLHFTLNWLAPTLRTEAAQAVLARRRRAPDLPGMWVLHPDDAFWALLLHVIVDKGRVKPQYADRLVALADQATPSAPLAQVVATACPESWDPDRIIRCARVRDWATLLELGQVLVRRADIRHPVAQRAGALARGMPRLGRFLYRLLVMPRIAVAVAGSDSALRSALVAGLLSERPLKARLVRSRLAATYHRLRGRTTVFDTQSTRPGRFLAYADPRPDVVLDSGSFMGRDDDVVADAVATVWRARAQAGAEPALRNVSAARRGNGLHRRLRVPRRLPNEAHDARNEHDRDDGLRRQVGDTDSGQTELTHQPPGGAE